MKSPAGIIRPTAAQALELLGKWVVCNVCWGEKDLEPPFEMAPSRIVGVVVPAEGSDVSAQILMHDGDEKKTTEGYQYELFLDTIKIVRILDEP